MSQGPHAGLLHRNDSFAHSFCLVFITLGRISMGLVKKRLTMQSILSTGRAQHKLRAGRKTRTGIGNKPPDSSFLHVALHTESMQGRDVSLLVTLENKKTGLANEGLSIAKLEPSLQWAWFCIFPSLHLPIQHYHGFQPNSALPYTIVKIKRINSIKVNKLQWDQMPLFQKWAKVMPVQPRAELSLMQQQAQWCTAPSVLQCFPDNSKFNIPIIISLVISTWSEKQPRFSTGNSWDPNVCLENWAETFMLIKSLPNQMGD